MKINDGCMYFVGMLITSIAVGNIYSAAVGWAVFGGFIVLSTITD